MKNKKKYGQFFTPKSLSDKMVETVIKRLETKNGMYKVCPRDLMKLTVLDPAVGSGEMLTSWCVAVADLVYNAECSRKNRLIGATVYVDIHEQTGVVLDFIDGYVYMDDIGRELYQPMLIKYGDDDENWVSAWDVKVVTSKNSNDKFSDPEYKKIIGEVAMNCFGYDIDQSCVDLTKQNLSYLTGISAYTFDANIQCADYLFLEERCSYDIVIMNPPYLGGRKISSVFGDCYRKQLKNKIESTRSNTKCETAKTAINSRLNPKPERPDPLQLAANANLSFVGSYVLGMGFTLTPDERDALIAKDKRNAERIFPYIGGEEVNTSPTQDFHRYVINFGEMSLEEAFRWPDLIEIVREKVKPERDKLRNNPDGRRLKQYWWQHCRTRPALYQAIQDLPRCLVNSRVSKHLMFTFQSSNRVFAESMYVFPMAAYAHFILIQSRIHEVWARLLSSSMKTDLRYAATDCFENFPFPNENQLTPNAPLEKIGKQLYEARAQYMIDTDQGLTKTYNALKDPDCLDPRIIQLRALHEEMDRAVLAAYGWEDISVPAYGTPATPEEKKALQAFSEEVIDRLFVLNAERVEAEGVRSKIVDTSGVYNGRADLCSYFIQLAYEHIKDYGGLISIVATNTISQGKTRLCGLKTLVDKGCEIYNAETNVPWPGDAKVTISIVHLDLE
jgi:hypothetical protein